MKLKKIVALVSSAILAFSLVGCSIEGEESGANSDGSLVGIGSLGFSVSTLNNPFFVTLSQGAKDKAKDDKLTEEEQTIVTYDKGLEKTRKESFTYSIINGLRNTFGFILACMITGAVREFLAFGTVCGVRLLNISLLPMAKTSFGGFIIIGLISAFWHYSVKNYRERLITEARKING